MIVIDTPDGIAAFQAIRLYYALKLEVQTGMTHSQGSVMNHIKRTYLPDCKARTKVKVLAEYGKFLQERGMIDNV